MSEYRALHIGYLITSSIGIIAHVDCDCGDLNAEYNAFRLCPITLNTSTPSLSSLVMSICHDESE